MNVHLFQSIYSSDKCAITIQYLTPEYLVSTLQELLGNYSLPTAYLMWSNYTRRIPSSTQNHQPSL